IVYMQMGEYAKTREYLLRTLELDEKLYGKESVRLAEDLGNLCAVANVEGRLAEASDWCTHALALCDKGCDGVHVATQLNNLASARRDQGRLDDALALARRAVALRETALGAQSPLVAESLRELGLTLAARRELDAARAALERVYHIYLAAAGANDPE